MKIETEIGLFPVGQLDGAAALTLDVFEASGDEIADEISRVRPKGVQVVWIRQAPWGQQEFDRSLHRAMSRHQAVFTAMREVGARAWSQLDINWVLDLTNVLREEITAEELFEKLFDPECPRPEIYEAFSIRPHRKNVTDAVLSVLTEIGAPLTVYADPKFCEMAIPSILRTTQPVLLRNTSEGLEASMARAWGAA